MKTRRFRKTVLGFFLCITILGTAEHVYADYNEDYSDSNDKSFAVTIYPVPTVLLTRDEFIYLSFELEFCLNGYLSIPVELRYLGLGDSSTGRFSMFNIGPGLRLYPQGEGMKGVFIGYYCNFFVFTSEDNSIKGHEYYSKYFGPPNYLISIIWAGHRWVFNNDIHIEFAAGYVSVYHFKGDNHVDKGWFVLPLPIISIGIGKSF